MLLRGSGAPQRRRDGAQGVHRAHGRGTMAPDWRVSCARSRNRGSPPVTPDDRTPTYSGPSADPFTEIYLDLRDFTRTGARSNVISVLGKFPLNRQRRLAQRG